MGDARETDAPTTKGAQTRQAILAAAVERFGRDGYRATSVADIARDAAVGGTVAYAYFPNKEALFLAAIDEDAAGVIGEGVDLLGTDDGVEGDWRVDLVFRLIGALDRHPLARRLLAGREPEVTARVLGIPALEELRKGVAERLRSEQLAGSVRADIDPTSTANGIVAILLSLLMSVVQLGNDVALPYADDVAGIFRAAVEREPR